MSTDRIALSIVLHNHQPVGNFGFVFEDNYRQAYAPTLAALEGHPGVSVGLHYSGPLLEWLRAEKPEAIELLQFLVARQQVEILGGGYYEPVLASLPQRDRLGQLVRMADEIEATFGQRPRGAWLAERVWEPDLPVALADAGYEYTVLDDSHLRAAAIPVEDHWATYTTDDQGRRLTVFGTEQGLRYHIPFRPVDDVIDYLRQHATANGERIGMVGDDGEKFGAWPGTWELCWGKEAWVERFFGALGENKAWLTTLRPGEAVDSYAPAGRVYVPTGSYAEMGEWSLPVEQRREYTRLLRSATEEGRAEADWMRGGFWRNFQVNYSEIGDLHKQMLRTSAAVALAADEADVEGRGRILDHLYQGQSNDCYWHGLFGGIYLSHMRLATAAHLIAAEDAADRLAGVGTGATPVLIEQSDIDLDGNDEIFARSAGQVIAIEPDRGGGISEWDVRPTRHALASVMRRRPEAYHDALIAHEAGEGGEADKGISVDSEVRVAEEGLSQRLWYDAYERRSALVRFLPPGASIDALERAEPIERGDFIDGAFEVLDIEGALIVMQRRGSVITEDAGRVPVRVRKTVGLISDRRRPGLTLSVEVANEGGVAIDGRIAIEWSLNLLGGGNPQAWYDIDRERHTFDSRGSAAEPSEVAMGNNSVGIALASRATPAADAWWYSIDTISLSEQGFERNHQGSCLLWSWALDLAPGRTATYGVDMRISTAMDRALDEGL